MNWCWFWFIFAGLVRLADFTNKLLYNENAIYFCLDCFPITTKAFFFIVHAVLWFLILCVCVCVWISQNVAFTCCFGSSSQNIPDGLLPFYTFSFFLIVLSNPLWNDLLGGCRIIAWWFLAGCHIEVYVAHAKLGLIGVKDADFLQTEMAHWPG